MTKFWFLKDCVLRSMYSLIIQSLKAFSSLQELERQEYEHPQIVYFNDKVWMLHFDLSFGFDINHHLVRAHWE